MAEIILTDVSKHFQNTIAMDKVGLKIPDGKFFTLLGPSGCGKTTTLRTIAGLEKPTTGSISINGRDVTKLPPKERNVAMVFQNYALYPHMTVAENIGYPLKIRHCQPAEIRTRVEEVAQNLQITSLLDRKPHQISGGQQQRVALARALIRKPDAFLFDEPLSNLDAKLRTDARTFLKHFQQELKITTIYVTHDQSEAMAMSDYIAVMEHGVVRQVGPAREIYHFPANIFVADFIGNPPMNLLPCRIRRHNQKSWAEITETVTLPLAQAPAVDGPCLLGIRPENITISYFKNPSPLPDQPENMLTGEVFIVEPLGAETLITVKMGSLNLKVRIPGDIFFDYGQKVSLFLNPDQIRFFSQDGRLVPVEAF